MADTEHSSLGGVVKNIISDALDFMGQENFEHYGAIAGGAIGTVGAGGLCFGIARATIYTSLHAVTAAKWCAGLGAAVGTKLGGDVGKALDINLGTDKIEDSATKSEMNFAAAKFAFAGVTNLGDGSQSIKFSLAEGRAMAVTLTATGVCAKKEYWGSDSSAIADYIEGCETRDWVHGRKGPDQVLTLGGNDYAFGEDGNDKIWGGAGHDYIQGGDGFDFLYGGTGNDKVDGGPDGQERDRMSGGPGFDTFYFKFGNDVVWDFQPGVDRAVGFGGDVERVTVNSASNRILRIEDEDHNLIVIPDGLAYTGTPWGEIDQFIL